jgi:hypothetical protein
MKFLAPSKDFAGAAAERARLGGGPLTAGTWVSEFPAWRFSSGEDVRAAPSSSGGTNSSRAPLAAELRRCLGMTSMTIPTGARPVRPHPRTRSTPRRKGLGTPKNTVQFNGLCSIGALSSRSRLSAGADDVTLPLEPTVGAPFRRIHLVYPRACVRARVTTWATPV